MSVLIKNGLVVTSVSSYIADVYVENGKIKAIGSDLAYTAETIVDATGKYVLPGAIDPHTHLAMPFMGTHAQDDYETGTIAAAFGGVPAVVDFDIQQKGESIKQALERKQSWAEGKVAVDYSLHPAITDPRPEVIDEIRDAKIGRASCRERV